MNINDLFKFGFPLVEYYINCMTIFVFFLFNHDKLPYMQIEL